MHIFTIATKLNACATIHLSPEGKLKMAKEIVNTEIRPQGGKLHALAHWQNGEEQGTDKKVFDDFNEAQAWLNDQQTATPEGKPPSSISPRGRQSQPHSRYRPARISSTQYTDTFC
jgi:hypothetical protein